MALNLNIPALVEKPFITADTRPQRVSQSLANLESQNPLDTASHLQIELEILNRQKVSPGNRIQALDSYRPSLMGTAQALAEDYSNAALPLHDKAKVAAAAAESLWLELAYGYKLALVDLQNQLIKLGTDKSSAHAIQRAMHAIAEHALVHYQTYTSLPNHIWGDLHQLYFCAVQLGVQNAKVGAEKLGSEPSPGLETSIENTYKHALLMSLADPQHLTQKDIRLIAEFLAYLVRDAQITAVTPLESSSGAFIINLSSNDPPVPYSKQQEAPDPAADILLLTMDLVRTIHQHLSNLQNNQLPKDGSIPTAANRSDYIDLLTYLIKHWGITPKRFFNRTQKNGELEVVLGISAIHNLSDNELTTINVTNKAADAELNTLQVKQAIPSRWKILNISATGMSIRRHPTAEKNIKIGSLLGIKLKGAHNWSLGLVRWASCGIRDRLDIGVQLIAPQARSATARINGRDCDEVVLLLPQIVAVKQAATIIAPIGTFEPARQLTLAYNNESKHVMLTKLVERSQHFERIQYSVIS
ncbi:MAG: hypothetical protein ACXW11_09005 [Methylotenera sp.]